jgi:L-fucose isomerase-like protein
MAVSWICLRGAECSRDADEDLSTLLELLLEEREHHHPHPRLLALVFAEVESEGRHGCCSWDFVRAREQNMATRVAHFDSKTAKSPCLVLTLACTGEQTISHV